ncbi:MAG: hypothetical protein HKN43_12605 [Rhodothermales bacterium]|nr:hypothetical protein [Rhodothermales bacterium]
MSGLAGIVFRDDRHGAANLIDNMVQSMQYRGPDGIDIWTNAHAMLGQCTLQSSSFSGSAIATGQSNDRFVVVGDVRIDNRDELLKICGHPGSGHPASKSDLALVKLLFESSGDAFIDSIEGDFAFVLYDVAERTIRCYRDHFGTRPFYYFLNRDLFVCASDIKGIIASGLVEDTIDTDKLEDYLVGNLANQERTFYKNIRRLPPASVMLVDPENVKLHKYWSVDQVETIDAPEDQMIAGFRSRFLTAVKNRIGSAGDTAFMLSGGLDSSSVVSSAAHIAAGNTKRFKTYSVEFPYLPDKIRSRTDETEYVDAVVGSSGLVSSRLAGDTQTPLSSLQRMLEIHDEPFLVPNAYLDAIALSAVHHDGCKVLLTGLEGDLTISHGDWYLKELGFKGEWQSFVRESRALAARTESEPELFFERYAVPTLQELARSGEWGAFRRGASSMGQEYGDSTAGLIWRLGMRPTLASIFRRFSQRETLEDERALRFVSRKYPGRKDIIARINESSHEMDHSRTQFDHHVGQLQSGYPASLLEFAEKNAANWQIDVRHPFFDRRLVEYSVGLPGSAKLSDGWARYILRASMEQILPDKVRWRAQKAALGPNFAYLMGKESEDRIRALAETAIQYFPYIIDKSSVSNLINRQKYATLWRILVLGGWVLQKRS